MAQPWEGKLSQVFVFWPMIYDRLQQFKRRLCPSWTQTYKLLLTGGQGKQSYLKFLSQAPSASIYTPEINSSPCTRCLQQVSSITQRCCSTMRISPQLSEQQEWSSQPPPFKCTSATAKWGTTDSTEKLQLQLNCQHLQEKTLVFCCAVFACGKLWTDPKTIQKTH